MAKGKRGFWFIAALVLFVVYFFTAARPVPKETALSVRWLNSVESAQEDSDSDSLASFPFTLGSYFGYLDARGHFAVNRIKQGYLSLSENKWAQYDAQPAIIEIFNKTGEITETVNNPRGYPMFLDGRTFIVGSEQNAISETDGQGNILWTHEFAAPLTCADAASGLVLTGSVDGIAEVLDPGGKKMFVFEPGGSQYSVILGCAISRDGSRLALVCGIGNQRFLLLEHFGMGEYKVIYHEFLGNGFRRPVYVYFIDRDRKVVFEREGGIGIYEINNRKSHKIALEGELAAVDYTGNGGMLFVIVHTEREEIKKLVGITLPHRIYIRAPFKSDDVFLHRIDRHLVIGGGTTLAAFELEKK